MARENPSGIDLEVGRDLKHPRVPQKSHAAQTGFGEVLLSIRRRLTFCPGRGCRTLGHETDSA